MDRHREIADYALSRSSSAVQDKPSAEPPSDSDFKSFVLYIDAARSQPSMKALEALNANPAMKRETLIQVVESLPFRPAWLESTPCLAVKSEKRAFMDAGCIKYISEYKHKGPDTYTAKKRLGHAKKDW
jgi:hypothetical protein